MWPLKEQPGGGTTTQAQQLLLALLPAAYLVRILSVFFSLPRFGVLLSLRGRCRTHLVPSQSARSFVPALLGLSGPVSPWSTVGPYSLGWVKEGESPQLPGFPLPSGCDPLLGPPTCGGLWVRSPEGSGAGYSQAQQPPLGSFLLSFADTPCPPLGAGTPTSPPAPSPSRNHYLSSCTRPAEVGSHLPTADWAPEM